MLVLKGVVDHLKRLFAPSVGQEIPSIEKYFSIVLELNRQIVIELPITNKVFGETEHFGMQVFENFWWIVILDRLINHFLEFCPGGCRLTHTGSQLVHKHALGNHLKFFCRQVI